MQVVHQQHIASATCVPHAYSPKVALRLTLFVRKPDGAPRRQARVSEHPTPNSPTARCSGLTVAPPRSLCPMGNASRRAAVLVQSPPETPSPPFAALSWSPPRPAPAHDQYTPRRVFTPTAPPLRRPQGPVRRCGAEQQQ